MKDFLKLGSIYTLYLLLRNLQNYHMRNIYLISYQSLHWVVVCSLWCIFESFSLMAVVFRAHNLCIITFEGEAKSQITLLLQNWMNEELLNFKLYCQDSIIEKLLSSGQEVCGSTLLAPGYALIIKKRRRRRRRNIRTPYCNNSPLPKREREEMLTDLYMSKIFIYYFSFLWVWP